MPQITSTSIAVICNYEIRPDRIGGMDRFFAAFDRKAKSLGYRVNWFFKGSKVIDFYKDLDITLTQTESVEALFLNHLDTNSRKYDHVITHFTELCSPFYKAVKLKTHAYCIAVDHNPRPLEGFHVRKRLKLKIKGLLYGRYIDLFIGVSKYTTTHILKDYGNFLRPKVQVIYNGIDTHVFKKQSVERSDFKFIVASHLRPSKGIQDLLRALNLVSEDKKHQLSVDIYGEGPMEHELKALSKSLNIEKYVTFKGSTSNLHMLFSNYSYMIQPTYMECFSLSILESLSANVPVITTQVGGNLEVIEDGINGFVYNAGDLKQLSVIIEDIIDGKKRIETAVDDHVSTFYDLERMVDDHLKLLLCT